ncbi:MAG: hypothetical protein Pg6C_11890 [Treponemataceae bacterium]|nr:MAG: hypothetical protein Pg6C_11890 [Treponemataceae bacterium]
MKEGKRYAGLDLVKQTTEVCAVKDGETAAEQAGRLPAKKAGSAGAFFKENRRGRDGSVRLRGLYPSRGEIKDDMGVRQKDGQGRRAEDSKVCPAVSRCGSAAGEPAGRKGRGIETTYFDETVPCENADGIDKPAAYACRKHARQRKTSRWA